MYFLSKITFDIKDEAGKLKSRVEQFLHDAYSYTEVEAQIYTFLQGRVKNFSIENIGRVRFSDIYEPFVGGKFFKVKVLENPDSGKPATKYHLVVASSVTDAERAAANRMKTWVVGTRVKGAEETEILGFWHPNNSDWRDDFAERMLILADEGFISPNINQTRLFDEEEPKDKPEPEVIEAEVIGLLPESIIKGYLPESTQAAEAEPETRVLALPVATDEGASDVEAAMAEKYQAAIDELSKMLELHEYRPVVLSKFRTKHGVGSGILKALCKLGCIVQMPKISPADTSRFIKRPSLSSLTGLRLLRAVNGPRNYVQAEAV